MKKRVTPSYTCDDCGTVVREENLQWHRSEYHDPDADQDDYDILAHYTDIEEKEEEDV